MTDYSLTRPGAVTAATLADALRRHHAAHGKPAVAVLVHRLELDHAAQALKALGLPLPVQVQPGLLAGEIGLR